MYDILHDFVINAPPGEVFKAISTSHGLDQWWTKQSSGEAEVGEVYELWFGPEWDWRASVTRCRPGWEFELQITVADEDWAGTLVGFRLEEAGEATEVRFHHRGWPARNHHYRRSSYCWAMYLRVLKRYLEQGETVPYEQRNDV